MAKAKKCDRCKKYYDKNVETGRSGSVLAGYSLITIHDVHIDDKDLCDECISKFKRFMDGCELQEE